MADVPGSESPRRRRPPTGIPAVRSPAHSPTSREALGGGARPISVSRQAGARIGGVGAEAAGPAAVPVPLPVVMERAAADRQVAVGAATVIVFSRVLDGPLVWLVAALVGVAVVIGAGWSRASAETAAGRSGHGGRWEMVVGGAAGIESGVVPGVLAAALTLAMRLVPLDWRLAAVGLACFVLLDRGIALERRFALQHSHEGQRWQLVLISLGGAFLGFAGVASMVSGGIVIPADGGSAAVALAEQNLVLLAGADAVIAGLLGFRLVRLGPAARREAAVSGAGYAAVTALGAGLLRAMAIPQLLGPALLTLVLYLWDALNATTPSIRRDPRWRWQVGLLLVLSAVVIAWNMRLRG